MKEYDRVDAAFYDCYATGLEDDVQFYVEEAQKAGSPILELGCGTGRILIPIAESGISIVGLDRANLGLMNMGFVKNLPLTAPNLPVKGEGKRHDCEYRLNLIRMGISQKVAK